MNGTDLWAAAMVESAQTMWIYLTPDQIDQAARNWLSGRNGPLTLRQVADGLEQELTTIYGPPQVPSPDAEPATYVQQTAELGIRVRFCSTCRR